MAKAYRKLDKVVPFDEPDEVCWNGFDLLLARLNGDLPEGYRGDEDLTSTLNQPYGVR